MIVQYNLSLQKNVVIIIVTFEWNVDLLKYDNFISELLISKRWVKKVI